MASPFEWKAVDKFDTYTNDLLKFVERSFGKVEKYFELICDYKEKMAKNMSIEGIMANLSMEEIISSLTSVENITSGREGTAWN